MRRIRYGCQTYPWKLHPERYTGEMDHIARVTAEAGFEGLEAEVVMLGDGFRDDPERLKDVLEENGLELCTLVLHLDWRGMAETAEERAEADRVIDYLSLFPKTKLMVSHHAVPGDRSADFGELTERRRQVLSCMSAVACRARGHIGQVHVSEPDRAIPYHNTRIDWPSLGRTLKEIGYDGTVTIESVVAFEDMGTYNFRLWRNLIDDTSMEGRIRAMRDGLGFLREQFGEPA